MSDMVRSPIDNVIISLEPGGHEYAVPPMVAAYINRLQFDGEVHAKACHPATLSHQWMPTEQSK